MDPQVAITWPMSSFHGWGVFGLNFVTQLVRRGEPVPLVLFASPSIERAADDVAARIAEIAKASHHFDQVAANVPPGAVVGLDQATVYHALGHMLTEPPRSALFRGRRNLGVVALEETDLDGDAIDRGGAFDRLVAVSTWCEEVLRAHGLGNTTTVLQGIEDEHFHPGPATGRFGDRFVVFSGGKLEYRKGQDIALAAFRAFHQRHPDSLLLTAWYNMWPETAVSLGEGPHVDAPPRLDGNGAFRIVQWAAEFGIPEDAVMDLGRVPNAQMPGILREAHAGLFPNRCEGGTNLVAMEALACGMPCVLSANTGHLDLIAGDRCFPLNRQSPLGSGPVRMGWGESSVEEAVECLERIYTDRAEAERRGARAAAFMRGFTWRIQTEKLLAAAEGPG